LDAGRLALHKKQRASTELHGNVEADDCDMIKLDVGGMRIVCRRAKLTHFSNSKLALLFSGRCDKKLLRDKEKRIFLDLSHDCFKIILEYISLCTTSPDSSIPPLPEVHQELKPSFDRM
jgi:hypothetical protein